MKRRWNLAALLMPLMVLLAGCGDDLEASIASDLESDYVFYEAIPDEDANLSALERILCSYRIGTVITDFPTAQMEANTHAQEKHVGHYIDGWNYYMNPITSDKTTPDNVSADEAEHITSFVVTPQPAWIVVSAWKPNPYTVVLDGNGGTYTDADGAVQTQYTMQFTYDEAQTLWENQFFRNGYRFNGWNTEENKGTTVPDYRDGAEVTNLTTERNGVFALYACWLKEKITVTFDTNGGEGTMDAVPLEVEQSLPANTFTAPEGHYFVGWECVFADGTVLPYLFGDGEELTEQNYPNEDCTLVARWELISSSVMYDANGGHWFDDMGNEVTQTAESFYYGVTQPLGPNQFWREGYDFDGWNTAADGTGTAYANQQDVTLKGDDLYLYAQWKIQTYTITYDANGGTGTVAPQTVTYTGSGQTIATNAFTKEGYTFAGWNTAADASGISYTEGQQIGEGYTWLDGDITLYAQWSQIFFTVTFDAAGGTAVESQSVPYGGTVPLSTPEKTGYDFAGWYTSTDGGTTLSGTAFDFTTPITQDYALYAKWTAKQYTITFNANGGTGAMSPQTFTYAEPDSLIANAFSKEGYNFAGWATSETAARAKRSAYADQAVLSATENMTLYAVWAERGVVTNMSLGLSVAYTSTGFTVTAPGGSSYQWMLSPVLTDETSQTYTVTYADYAGDTSEHLLIVLVFDDTGMPAMYSLKFTVY